ncbi:MAG: type I methionyl aminopeptidase [Lachnospiraceae bacterium]|jgi:methionyl aminopeptidase|nr:type I methionyl aminopeptidase [Lachnospiraceae bacterium]MEE3461185.1 type I methionyl aminopeptidase [Lachnospiraceae bacterium]
MAVTIKTKNEIQLMREAGEILSNVHDYLEELVEPGISTYELDRKAEEFIRKNNCEPSFKGYDGFPASICASINEQIIHGIPDKKTILHDGDIISIDTGVIWKGYQSDAARTWTVGTVSEDVQKLVDVTRQSFFEGIKKARAGGHLFDIGKAIQDYVTPYGFGIVRDYVGHGIGTDMHEDPSVPNFKPIGRGMRLEAGMTLAIEPMITLGSYDVEVLDNDWTVVTDDGSYAAHYENTILITDGDPEILSLTHEPR